MFVPVISPSDSIRFQERNVINMLESDLLLVLTAMQIPQQLFNAHADHRRAQLDTHLSASTDLGDHSPEDSDHFFSAGCSDESHEELRSIS